LAIALYKGFNMVISSGRYVTCHYCGRIYPEGDCRRWYCSDECRKAARKEDEEFASKVELEVAKAEYRKCPDYQI
jgi:hypothetical protein